MLLYHSTASLMQIYRKCIGELMCVGPDGLMHLSLERTFQARTHHLSIWSAHTSFIE